jgi:uncharacterized protein (TIGR03435 family)
MTGQDERTGKDEPEPARFLFRTPNCRGARDLKGDGEGGMGRKLLVVAANMAAIAGPIVIGGLSCQRILAQSTAAVVPKFVVASIRPCKDPSQEPPIGHRPGGNSSPGRLATDCVELLNLIGNAYNAFADGHLNLNADPAPVHGGPAWLHSAWYEINAKADGNPSVEMMSGPMMQALLEDRFQLKIHRQTSEGPVYFLTVARGGSKLHAFVEGSCTPYSTLPPPPLGPGKQYCESMISGVSPSVVAQGATLDEFSKTLRVLLDRPVINETGITGRFDIRVRFSREGTTTAGVSLVPRNDGSSPASDPAGPPSIFTALQEQLGLKLEPGKGPMEVLVIDRIERPSEN